MPLAIATGRGPDLLTGLESRSPYVAEADAVLVGCRDLFDVTGTDEKWVVGTGIRVRDLEEVRRLGPAQVATEVLDHLTEAGVEGAWVHLDVDVLDPAIMPAVDSPDPGGLSADELSRLLGPLMRSEMVWGMQITIYDPERDPGGGAADTLVGVMKEAVSGAPRQRDA